MASREEVVAAMRAAFDALDAEVGQPLDVSMSDDALLILAAHIQRLVPFPLDPADRPASAET